ncbi:sel1 repeat family protein, partial [Acinetobacter baumannii]
AYRAAQHILYAAEKGVAAAQYDIASMYQTGVGVANDGVQAARWMSRAAAAGHTAAQYDYAVLLLRGLGLEKDKPKAIEYLIA